MIDEFQLSLKGAVAVLQERKAAAVEERRLEEEQKAASSAEKDRVLAQWQKAYESLRMMCLVANEQIKDGNLSFVLEERAAGPLELAAAEVKLFRDAKDSGFSIKVVAYPTGSQRALVEVGGFEIKLPDLEYSGGLQYGEMLSEFLNYAVHQLPV